MIRRVALPLLLVAAMFALAAAPAAAGKSSLSLVLLTQHAATSDGWNGPYFGDEVTFAVSTDRTNKPWVNVNCYQGGAWVYGQWKAMYTTDTTFTLGPTPRWTDGGGDCTARLVRFDSRGMDRTLASTSFAVHG